MNPYNSLVKIHHRRSLSARSMSLSFVLFFISLLIHGSANGQQPQKKIPQRKATIVNKAKLLLQNNTISNNRDLSPNRSLCDFTLTPEILLVKKDTGIALMRLEKGYSNQEMKVKMMGMGGMDQGYSTDGEKSTIRLTNGSNLLFIFYTGEPASASMSPEADSAMKANGMNMSSMPGMSSMWIHRK